MVANCRAVFMKSSSVARTERHLLGEKANRTVQQWEEDKNEPFTPKKEERKKKKKSRTEETRTL